MKKKVAVLGATGSVGRSTMDVLRNHKDRFEPVLFSAQKRIDELLKLKKEFPGALIALVGAPSREPEKKNISRDSTYSEIDFTGKTGLLNAIADTAPDITFNCISGAAGLEPSAAVIKAGSDLALANKETIVMASRIIINMAAENNVRIIPVDSEHSAIFKLIEAHGKENIAKIIITASGGPFRNFSMEKLSRVTPEEALAHPTWNMGPKITVDSATLANKGLEVIEAAGLFGFPPEKIEVTIHPQSLVHGMVCLKNGTVYAQMSKPDMKLPVHEALFWPETESSPYGALDFGSLSLTFEKPDPDRFPMLALAYKALNGDPLLPVVYNAANEAAVEAFFSGKIGFLDIPQIVGYVLDHINLDHIRKEEAEADIKNVLALDQEVRDLAGKKIRSKNADI